MNKKQKHLLLATGLGMLAPAVVATAVSCKKPDQVLQDAIDKGFDLKATSETKKVTPQYVANEVARLKSENKDIKEFLSKFITNWPTVSHVVITPIDVTTSSSNDKAIVITFEYDVRGKKDYQDVLFAHFRSQSELDELYVTSAIKKEWTITKNEEEMLKVSATEAVANIESGVPYTKYFDGIPSQVEGSNAAWVNGTNDQFYTTATVKVDMDSLQFVALDETQLKVIATYKYGSASQNKEYVVKGFANVVKEFNDKVASVELRVTEQALSIAPSSVTKDNLSTYVQGIPATTSSFNVSIDNVSPKESTPLNTILSVTITFTNPNVRDLTKTVVYDVTGFSSEADVDEKIVDASIATVKNTRFELTEQGAKKSPSEITTGNIGTYVKNIPTQVNGVKIVVSNVEVESLLTGTITVTFSFTKGSISKIASTTITGFLTSSAQDEMFVNEMYNKGLNNLTVTEKAKEVLPTAVNKENVEMYITGWPELQNGVSRNIIFFPDNSTGILRIYVSYNKNSFTSPTIEKVFNQFKTSSSQDQDEVNQVASSMGDLVATDSVSTTYIGNINTANVTDYATGWPWTPGTINDSNGIIFVIESVSVKNEGSGVYKSQTLSVQLRFQKNSAISRIVKDITGFISEEQNDTNIINSLADSIQLGVSPDAANTRVTEVNTGSYSSLITGIPTNNNSNVLVIILNIAPKNNDDKNQLVNVSLQLNRGQVTKTITKEAGPFLSNWDYFSNLVQETANEQSTSINLQINELGRQTVASSVTTENVNRFITGAPTSANGIYVEVTRVSIDASDDSTIEIEFTYKYALTSGVVSASISKKVSGFRTKAEQEQLDVEAAAAKQPDLAITVAGTKVVASTVNKGNFNDYVSGIIDKESNNGVETIIDSISVNSSNDSQLIVKLYFRKGVYSSSIVTKYVNGFKSVAFQNYEDAAAVYENYKDVVLTVTEKGKEVVSSRVNESNIYEYVQGLPEQSSIPNNVTFVIDQLIAGDGSLNIIFYFKKGTATSTQINKTITGFKKFDVQDQQDVEAFIAKGIILAINSEGTKVSAQKVTEENITEYVSGIPTTENGVQVEITNVEPKTLNITDSANNTTIIVEITFTKNTYSLKQTYEVFGFKTPTESEIFEYKISLIEFGVSATGTTIVAYNLTQDNIKNAIATKIPDDFREDIAITFQSWTIADDDGVSIKINVNFRSGLLDTTKQISISGFKSRRLQSTENLSSMFNQFVNLSPKSTQNLAKVLTKTIYDDKKLVNTYFNVPETLQWIEVSYTVDYAYTNTALSNTTLLIKWTIKNTITSETKEVSTRFEGFKDPYGSYNLEGSILRTIGYRSNSNGVYTNHAVDSEGHLKGTWQSTWAQWGYHQILNDFEAGNSNYQKSTQGFANTALKDFFGSDPVTYSFVSLARGIMEWDKSGQNGMSGWVVWLTTTVTYNIQYQGYAAKKVTFILKVGVRNGYWK